MARLDPAKLSQKWNQAISGAAQNYTDGINAVTASPMQAAIAKQSTLVQRFLDSVNNGSWAASLNAVTLDSWKRSATSVGAQNLVNGAKKGAPKVQAYFAKAAPEIERIRSEVRAMPNSTQAEREQRMLTNMRLMAGLKGISKR